MEYRQGDVLLYSSDGFYGRLIKIKTWSDVSHCEVVHTNGSDAEPPLTAAARGDGVNVYPFTRKNLIWVLRPTQRFDAWYAHDWFASVRGQKYDWIGLAAFWSAKLQGRDNGRMFCSEAATRYLRAGHFDPFNGYDADGIAPGDFLKSAPFQHFPVVQS